jgi:hypothetical protein
LAQISVADLIYKLIEHQKVQVKADKDGYRDINDKPKEALEKGLYDDRRVKGEIGVRGPCAAAQRALKR